MTTSNISSSASSTQWERCRRSSPIRSCRCRICCARFIRTAPSPTPSPATCRRRATSSSATAVEHDRKSVATIKKLADEWDAPVTAIAGDVFAEIPRLRGRFFDVIYADPPYSFGRYDDLLAAIDTSNILNDDALVAIEHQRRSEPFTIETKHLKALRRAEYGEVWITLF